MAYTPPLGNAVNFDGTGAAYSPPLGDAVNFDKAVGFSISVDLTGQVVTVLRNPPVASIPGQNVSVGLVLASPLTIFRGPLVATGSQFVALTGEVVTVSTGALAPSIYYTPPVIAFLSGLQLVVQADLLNYIAVTDPSVWVSLSRKTITVNPGLLERLEIKWNKAHEFYRYTRHVAERLDVSSAPSDPIPITRPYCLTNGDGFEYRKTPNTKYYFEVGIQLPSYDWDDRESGMFWEVGVTIGTTRLDGFQQPPGSYFIGAFAGNDYVSGRLRFFDLDGSDWLLLPFTRNQFRNGMRMQFAIDFAYEEPGENEIEEWGKLWFGIDNQWFHHYEQTDDQTTGGHPLINTPLKTIFVNNPDRLVDDRYPPPHKLVIYAACEDFNIRDNDVAALATLYAKPNNQLFRPNGFQPWDESIDNALSLLAYVGQGTIEAHNGTPLDPIPLTVQRGMFTTSGGVPDVRTALARQTAKTQQGTFGFIIVTDKVIPLQGLVATVQRTSFSSEVSSILSGKQIAVQKSTFSYELGVVPTGQEAVVYRGMFPGMGVEIPIHGFQVAVQVNVLSSGVACDLVPKLLTIASGTFVPASSLQLVGRQLQVDLNVFVPLVSALLPGTTVTVFCGAPGFAFSLSLTGLQAAVLRGQVDFLYDGNVFPGGVWATGMVGEEPTSTNVPGIPDKMHLWAKAEVEKLFAKVTPDSMFNDIEPSE